MTIQWTPNQAAALTSLGNWLDGPYDPADPIRYLAGYAGVGKTELLKHLAASTDKLVLFAAYTGKAAYVMRSKGCVNATTVHSLIYKPNGESKSDQMRQLEMAIGALHNPATPAEAAEKKRLESQRDFLAVNEKRKPMFQLNHDSELNDAHALILDECSMIDEYIGQDLLSFKRKILVAGDPAQLPPVGAGGFFTNREPDHLLTEVHRQARESGILRMATDVRSGNFNRTPGHYGDDCIVVPRGSVPQEAFQKIVLDADQLLVGLNATRHASNAKYRTLIGRPPGMPVGGDKVVCLRNNHKAGLLNGSLWRVHEAAGDLKTMVAEMTISSEEDGATGIEVSCWGHHFLGQEDELKKMFYGRREREEFDYGYALTVHKAQGSQWDDVAIIDESGAFRHDARRWLYTGVTRAAKKLTVIV